MKRKVFDLIASFVGLGIAIVLFIAGGLMLWAHNFVDDQVKTQLSAQKIFFPKADDPALAALPAADAAAMKKYAGEQLTTGDQAKTWADHYINAHLQKIGGGKTYSQLSGESLADPSNTQLAETVQTVFRGETLRGLLLNAYAFSTMAKIAGIGSIVAFVGGAAMLVLSGLGFWHASRTDKSKDVLGEHGDTTSAPSTT
jgi:hypothetical protein